MRRQSVLVSVDGWGDCAGHVRVRCEAEDAQVVVAVAEQDVHGQAEIRVAARPKRRRRVICRCTDSGRNIRDVGCETRIVVPIDDQSEYKRRGERTAR